MKITLIRGLPGSGKSTMAKAMGVSHFEADMFFMVEGVYTFDHKKLSAAHAWCQEQARNALAAGTDVVVSNTFTKVWEMQPYIDMAAQLGAQVDVLTATGTWANVHGVPEAALAAMAARWEKYPA